jgi:hypothetical protein
MLSDDICKFETFPRCGQCAPLSAAAPFTRSATAGFYKTNASQRNVQHQVSVNTVAVVVLGHTARSEGISTTLLCEHVSCNLAQCRAPPLHWSSHLSFLLTGSITLVIRARMWQGPSGAFLCLRATGLHANTAI